MIIFYRLSNLVAGDIKSLAANNGQASQVISLSFRLKTVHFNCNALYETWNLEKTLSRWDIYSSRTITML